MPAPADRAKTIFLKAVEIASAPERLAYLDAACAGDAALRREVEDFLGHHDQLGSFLQGTVDQPAIGGYTTDLVAASAPLECPGTVIGPYKLLQQIGEGGMGTVFLAEQKQPVQRRVALKLTKSGMDSRQVIARFEAERQALALMDHPNIAKVLDAGTTATGRPYFVMELVKGVPITRYCDEHRLTPKERLELFVPVCQAVQHAHQKSIIHRDLKPSNVLVCLYDDRPVPKVIDFGVAKATGPRLTDKTLFTEIGSVVGTLEYMSPEQAEFNQLDVDTRSDIYSLGALLYELLTGTTPLERKRFQATAFLEVLRLIREEEPPKPSTRLSTAEGLPSIAANRGLEPKKLGGLLRGELDWIVMKSLEKDRKRRYETPHGLALDVQRYLDDEPVEAGPPSATYKLRKFARRHRALLVSIGAFVCFLAAVAVLSTGLAFRATRAEQTAREEQHLAQEQAAVAQAVNAFFTQDVLGQATISAQTGPATRANPQLTVRSALDRAAQTIGGKFAQEPRVEVNIRRVIGIAYDELSEFPKAQEHLERAWRLARERWGDEDSETLACASALGNLFLHQGKLTKAEEIHAQSLEVSRRLRGKDHPATLEALHNLATVYVAKGMYIQAESVLSEVLEARRRVLGKEHRDALRTMNTLAAVYQLQEKPEKDEPAERLHAEVFEISRRVFGEEHPDTLRAMDDFLLISIFRGKFAQAEPLATRLVEICRRAYGDKSTYTIEAVNDMALLYQEEGKFAEAEKYYAQALESGRAVFGENSPTTLMLIQNLAKVYHDQNKLAQAEPLCRQALDGRRKYLGEDHPKTILSMNRLARLYQDLAKFEAADVLFCQVVAIQRRKLGTEDREFADALGELVDARLARKAFEEAETPLQEHLDLSQKKEPPDWRFFDSRLLRGARLAGQQKFTEAEPFLARGYEGLKAREKELSFQTKARLSRTVKRVAQLYEQAGKPVQAAEWRAKPIGP